MGEIYWASTRASAPVLMQQKIFFEFYGNIDEVNFRWQTEWGGEAEVALGFFPRPTTRSPSLPRHRVVL